MRKKCIEPVFLCIFLFASLLYARDGLSPSYTSEEIAKSLKVSKIYPVPGEDPVYVGGVKLLTPEEEAAVPPLSISFYNPFLPVTFSNIDSKYLRPAFAQKGPSCAQAAAIGYHYTYAINQMRDTDAKQQKTNQYFYVFTWNFLNQGGFALGSSFLQGWQLANENGIVDSIIWGNNSPTWDTKWLTGHDKYLIGMRNRYVQYNKVDVSSPQGIDTLKQWIHNLGEGAAVGGIASFSCRCNPPLHNLSGNPIPKLPTGTPEEGRLCVPFWGDSGGHVMTIIGWHDSVRLDLNNDGLYTNDRDINGDGVVDVGDWEIGAWLVLNSWGAMWGNEACYYMLYRTGALSWQNAYLGPNQYDLTKGGLTTGKYVYTLRGRKVADKATQAFAFKVNMSHTQRNQISLVCGVANDTGAVSPVDYSRKFFMFGNQGGPHPMQGSGGSPSIEIGLYVKDLLDYVNQKQAKFFFKILAKDSGTGSVESFSLMDYRSSSPVEQKCTETNKTITPNAATVMSILYTAATEPLTITTNSIPPAGKNTPYSTQLQATGGTPPYSWEVLKNDYYEASGGSADWQINTMVPALADPDDGLTETNLPFSFPFFGAAYDKIYIATDGNIQFETTSFIKIRSRESLIANKTIAVLSNNLYYQPGDSICYSGNAQKVIIRWHTKHMLDSNGKLANVDFDFACVLYPSGKIEYYYGKSLIGNVGMIIGVSNGAGSYFSRDYGLATDMASNYTFALMPVNEQVNGLSIELSNGIFSGTPVNDNGDYPVTFAVRDALEITKCKTIPLKIEQSGIADGSMHTIITPVKVITGTGSVCFFFATNKTTHTIVEIFSLNGRKIETIYKGKLEKGVQKIVWHVGKENKAASNGVYLCKLSVGNEKLVKKIALFR